MIPKALDIGCGPNKQKLDDRFDIIGMDWYPFDGVDVVRDLMRGIPFCDDYFDVVIAKHVIEHFADNDLIFLVDEIWRVVKPGGIIEVVVPDITSPNRYRDPTHKTRDWSEDSFMFWQVDEDGKYVIFHESHNIKAKFSKIETAINGNKDRFYRLHPRKD